MTDHALRPDFWLVVQRHPDHWWNIPEIRPLIDRIETVFLFDRNLHVHCCEFTPSYELWPVETRAILKPEFADNDALVDKVDNVIMGNASREIEYHHVHPLDRRIEDKSWPSRQMGDMGCPKDGRPPSYEEVPYDDVRDSSIEYLQGNSCI